MIKSIKRLSILLLCAISLLFFVAAIYNSRDTKFSHSGSYLSGNLISDEPVLELDGVTITACGWTDKAADNHESGRAAEVHVEFQAENPTDQTVIVGHEYIFINGQAISNTSPAGTDEIPPGESRAWTMRIEEFSMLSQRVKYIKDLEVSFFIVYPQNPEETYRYSSNTVPILKHSQEGKALATMDGNEIYQDEYLTLTAASDYCDFPGAYVLPIHAENQSGKITLLQGKLKAINGNEIGEDSPLYMQYAYCLFPGKTCDINIIIYIKSESGAQQVPLENIQNITFEINRVSVTTDEKKGHMIPEPELEPVTLTVQI